MDQTTPPSPELDQVEVKILRSDRVLPNQKDPSFLPSNDRRIEPLLVASLVLSISSLVASAYLIFDDGQPQSREDSSTSYQTSSKANLYTQPEDLKALITKVRAATLTIYCGENSGSGWGIDLSDYGGSTKDDKYPYEIVTNQHVIESCIDGSQITFTGEDSSVRHTAKIWSIGKSNADIALLMTGSQISALKPLGVEPEIGQWVMAVGSPGSWKSSDGLLKGNVTLGRVTNIIDTTIVTDAAVNYGNSGGPLVNSRGQVVGTNTWIELKDQVDNIAYAQGTPVLCKYLIKCQKSLSW